MLAKNNSFVIPNVAKDKLWEHDDDDHPGRFHPVDLQQFLKKAMDDEPGSLELTNVYRKLYGGRPDVEMHKADSDTLILNDIIRTCFRAMEMDELL